MFNASRFNRIVTGATQRRLLLAGDNSQPITTGERERGAVVAIQSALASLNGTYLTDNDVDGFFGPRTATAVENFQRDYGLAADRIVGRQVLTQLDALFSGDVVRQPHGVSIHVGVDRVDPQHYGSEMKLPSCGNDARAMAEVATSLGYDPVVLVDEEATTSNFAAFIRNCAANLFADDCLLISFSGHGSQIPNNSSDQEPDLLDETMCFHDRMLVDDELFGLLSELHRGVRVHVFFDSCHSGTAIKAPISEAEVKNRYTKEIAKSLATVPYTSTAAKNSGLVPTDLVPIKSDSLEKALDGEEPELVEQPSVPPADGKDIAALFGELDLALKGESKFMEGSQVYRTNQFLYDTVKDVIGTKEADQLECSVISVSACADPQTTPAGNPLSLFTYNVIQVWDRGNFDDSYGKFHTALLNLSPQDSTPQLNAYGAGGARGRSHERPFMF